MQKPKFAVVLLFLASSLLSGCITVGAILLPKFEEEDLYHAGRYTELIRLYDDRYSPAVRAKLFAMAKERAVNPSLIGIVDHSKYVVAQRWLPRALIETGQFTRARVEIDSATRETLALMSLQGSPQRAPSKSLIETLVELRRLRQYLDWFQRGDQRGLSAPLTEQDLQFHSPSRQLPMLVERAFVEDKVFGNSAKALEYLDKTLAIAGSLGVGDIDAKFAYSLQAYKRKAWIQMQLGRLAEAKSTLEEYEAMASSGILQFGMSQVRSSPYFRGYLSMIHSTAGAVHSASRDFVAAKRHFDAAQESLKTVPADSPHMWDRSALAAYHVLHGAYFLGNQGRHQDGARSIEQGLAYLRPAYIDALFSEVDIETAYLQSAQLHFRLGQMDIARQRATQAHEFAQRYHSAPTLAAADSLLSTLLMHEGRPQDALQYFERAEAGTRGIESAENWHIYHGLGQAQTRVGRTGAALQSHRRAIEEVEKLWAGRFDDVPRQLSFMGDRFAVYESAIEALIDQRLFEEAFGVIEKSKARAAYEVRSAVAGTGASGSAAAFAGKPLSLVQARQLLPADTALIEYFVGSRLTLGLVIRADGASDIRRLGVTAEDLRNKVYEFQTRIRANTAAATNSLGQQLYDTLVRPFERQLAGAKYVGIVPHGALHALPFPALVASAGNGRGRYFIERHALFNATSASLLAQSVAVNRQKRASVLILASPPEVSADDAGLREPLYKLESAQVEGRSIGRLFNKATVLIDTAASESNAKRYISIHDNVLISAHAVIRNADPLSSAIFLAPDGTNDGRLTIREIERQEMAASLVVLSACTTGAVSDYFGSDGDELAQFPPGDDLVSINRAFLKAGAASVMSSLWRVDDDATDDLIRRFFRHYLAGKARAAALQAAAIEVLDQKGTGELDHPRNWGAWTISGDWR